MEGLWEILSDEFKVIKTTGIIVSLTGLVPVGSMLAHLPKSVLITGHSNALITERPPLDFC